MSIAAKKPQMIWEGGIGAQEKAENGAGLRLDSTRDTVYGSGHQRHVGGDELSTFKERPSNLERHLEGVATDERYIQDVRASSHSL